MLLAPNLLVFQILGEQIFALDVILPSGETSSISLSLNRHICAIVCFSEKKKKNPETLIKLLKHSHFMCTMIKRPSYCSSFVK